MNKKNTLFFSIIIFLSINTSFSSGPPSSIKSIYLKLKKETLKNAFEIKKLGHLLEKKKADGYTTFAGILPSLKGSLTRDYNPDENDISGKHESTLKFTLSSPIYDKRKLSKNEQTKKGIDLIEHENELKKIDLGLRFREVFGGYLIQLIKINYFLQTIKTATKNFQFIQKGYQLGRSSKLDLIRAKANVDSLVTQLNQEIILKDANINAILNFDGITLAKLKGYGIDNLIKDEKSILPQIEEFTRNKKLFEQYKNLKHEYYSKKEDSFSKNFANNSLLYQKILMEEDLGLTKANSLLDKEYPDLDFKITYQKKTDRIANLLEDNAEGQLVFSATLSFPLFSFGTLFSNRREMQETKAISRITRIESEMILKNTIQKEVELISTMMDNLRLQEKLVKQNKEIAKLSLTSYKLKKTDLQDLLVSENTLITSKTKLISDKIYISNLIRRLFFKVGGIDID